MLKFLPKFYFRQQRISFNMEELCFVTHLHCWKNKYSCIYIGVNNIYFTKINTFKQ